ncbi:competence protein ComK [Niallia sp.]|uniref:competence protein ComK n=1 Tax=Niallia sp. TaxID=2837523 RepID=UPI002898D299|nr:competence protein ComK [Niallia sp.]
MKEEIIVNKYRVNENTMLINPIEAIEYYAVAEEVDRKVFVKQTPFEIVKENLLIGGSDFDGRCRSITYKLEMQKKLPMPIIPPRNIYAFPTHSPTKFCCQWIFVEHIEKIFPVKNDKDFKSVIYFKNGEKVYFEVSPHVLDTQLVRTWKVRKSMEDLKVIPSYSF